MIKILRKKYCVIAYNEDENRAIAFPRNTKVKVNDFINELKEIAEKAEEIRAGIVVVSLVFDPKYKENYEPMKKFLQNKNSPILLRSDKKVKELYDFYFSNAIIQLSPAGPSYCFVG